MDDSTPASVQNGMDVDTPPSVTSTPAVFSLDSETFKKIHPTEYHRRFLSQGVRADGRTLSRFRKAKITVGAITTAHGSAMARLGETTVVCGIKAEITEPKTGAPRDGFIVPNFDLPPLSSPQFKPGPPSELSQSISEYINRVLESSKLLNLSDLCIEEGRAVWVLYADIVCLNYEGNAMDAAMLALVAALQHVRLPTATFYEADNTVRVKEQRTIPLKLSRTPISVTFGVFDGQFILADPDIEEEPHLSSQLTVIIEQNGGLCGMLKPGGSPLGQETLTSCLEAARTRATDILGILEGALAER
ncbi:hypothetical protein SpCBS45565_g06952 [Spizellomyces sp. 'palustris']|nr:hypothetical protein SpCBS45565_g06952 [Spizellomyces sp. 'palustris']